MNWKFWKKEKPAPKYKLYWEKKCPYTGKLLIREAEPLGDRWDTEYWNGHDKMVSKGWVLRKRVVREQ